jgi:hypothetical protein
LAQSATLSMPFFLAGTIKIVYDLWLLWAFARVQPPPADSRQKDSPTSSSTG